MIISSTGKVCPGFHVLGHSATPSYLAEAETPALFDAGFTCLGPAYEEDIKKILGPQKPGIIFLTHVHFDHCGAVSYLKKVFPGLKVAASQRAAEIMSRPGAIKLMTKLNENATLEVEKWHPGLGRDIAFLPFQVDMVLSEGDEVKLGRNTTVKVLYTPGHTWDFLSFHLKEKDILISSEATGCADATGYIVTEFLVNHAKYLENIKRAVALKPKMLCQGHRRVYTDEDVGEFLKESEKAALDYKKWVDRLLLEQQGNIKKVMEQVKAAEYDPCPQPKQPEPAYLLNLEARVSHLARELGFEP
ncbi:MBL fold metallo-hydrolase [Dethiosulfatarculus sandiegensis]|uniref:Metallo-beta-lactamase domain-containing protein n=1 Tax=Dethiosulfatarculus sandiegensis TaxID=1429043 RepID=A0A0D2JC25_9BACT|nr:MBL fold metallo-hydrolase [Dethiosulfatarculus sandiegensis]KIX15699.1 hypothetical protein X474_02430 [Dethiosulfatarculus sandiegensis]